MKKIISFSLWFQDKPMDGYVYQTKNMYYNGLIRNLEILNQKQIYNDWIIRVYINNSLSGGHKKRLTLLGAEIIDMTGSKIPGMFWRFLPFQDKNVDIFVVRDTDSRINKREYKAVCEWEKSKMVMHVMRDHPHHKYKILGGMWGYKNYKEMLNVESKMVDFL